MTLSRNHAVVLVILAVVATAVWVAIRYVDEVFEERERQEDLILEGRSEELAGKPPPPRPPAQPPLDRPTTRGTEVIVLWIPPLSGGPPSRRGVVVRGNGEFVRLPSKPDEPGPVVTGLLDREAVDELARFVLGPQSAENAGTTYSTTVTLASGKQNGSSLSNAGAKRLFQLVGKSMNRAAAPDAIRVWTQPDDKKPATEAWPFPKSAPEWIGAGNRIAADSDRARFRDAVGRLIDREKRFSHAGKVWQVADLDLIP